MSRDFDHSFSVPAGFGTTNPRMPAALRTDDVELPYPEFSETCEHKDLHLYVHVSINGKQERRVPARDANGNEGVDVTDSDQHAMRVPARVGNESTCVDVGISGMLIEPA